jgi:hypothetical protein
MIDLREEFMCAKERIHGDVFSIKVIITDDDEDLSTTTFILFISITYEVDEVIETAS